MRTATRTTTTERIDTPTESPFLVVDDDEHVARSYERLLAPLRPVLVAGSIDDAYAMLDGSARWCAWFIDVRLGDGVGFEVLEHARRQFPGVPAAVVSAHLDSDLVNRAARLRAQYVAKGDDAVEIILAFARFACMLERVGDERIARAIEVRSQRARLSASERDVFVDLVCHADVESAPTTQMLSLLARLGYATAADARLHVLSESVVSRGGD